MSEILPPRTHPGRSAVVRQLHARWLRWESRPTFRATAQRLGICEAEVTAAHRGPCVRPVRLPDADLLDALTRGAWLVQVGDAHAFIQLRCQLGQALADGEMLTWMGRDWALSLAEPERCQVFLLRRCCRAARSNLLLCDPQGDAVLRLLPVDSTSIDALQRLWQLPDVVLAEQPEEPSARPGPLAPDLPAGLSLFGLIQRCGDDATPVQVALDHGATLSMRFRGPVQPGPTDGRMISARVGAVGLGLDLDSPVRSSDAGEPLAEGTVQISLPRARWRFRAVG